MKKLIIADDDPGIRDVFDLVLRRAGYAVTIYSNGEILLCNNFEIPDLFIIDKQMSGVDGLEVCKFLKQQAATQHVPVIMLSASPHIAGLAKNAGADEFVEKPFKIRSLLEIIQKHLGDSQHPNR